LLDPRRADEEARLPGRLAAMTRDPARRHGEIRAIELADAIVREAGPFANGVRARFGTHETQGQVEAQPIARVAIVRDAHEFSPVSFVFEDNFIRDTAPNSQSGIG